MSYQGHLRYYGRGAGASERRGRSFVGRTFYPPLLPIGSQFNHFALYPPPNFSELAVQYALLRPSAALAPVMVAANCSGSASTKWGAVVSTAVLSGPLRSWQQDFFAPNTSFRQPCAMPSPDGRSLPATFYQWPLFLKQARPILPVFFGFSCPSVPVVLGSRVAGNGSFAP